MSIDNALEELNQYREKHLVLGKAVMEAYGRTLYVFDILVVATLNRSLCLLKGFTSLIEAKNFVAAAPLIRLFFVNRKGDHLAIEKGPTWPLGRELCQLKRDPFDNRKGGPPTDPRITLRQPVPASQC